MGELRKIVEDSVKHLKTVKQTASSINPYKNYEQQYKSLEGKRAVWKTKNSPVIKAPRLVTISHAYPFHVLVTSENITYDGSHHFLNYSIEYASIISGFDTLRILS